MRRANVSGVLVALPFVGGYAFSEYDTPEPSNTNHTVPVDSPISV